MRNIDCYLTDEEKSAISDYLLYGLIAENLTQIEAKRRLEYNKQINKMVPNTALTYQTFNQKNDIICPIEVFLNSFSNILENAKLRPENQDLLKKLETGISECGASCPCPAECK
jgi:hypothetical protein